MELNPTRLAWDLKRRQNLDKFEAFWRSRYAGFLPSEQFQTDKPVYFEVGAGSGWFFTEMAKRFPEIQFLAVERARDRGTRLVRKTQRAGLPNLVGFRGNAIPALIHGIPAESVSRLFILYPAPWPKISQRKNRWYLHPILPHLMRVLKPGGELVWASDQKFYIDEAKWVCEERLKLETLAYGPIAPNEWNGLLPFPEGRTKFERTFLAQGQPCYELICRRPSERHDH